MRTKLIRTTVHDLDDDDYQKCRSLNFRGDGSMRYELDHYRNDMREAYAYLIKDISSDQLIAWCMVMPKGYRKKWLEVHFYTRKSHRRRGYGTRLLNAVKKDFYGAGQKILVSGHDDTAVKFFNSVGSGFYDHYGTGKIK